jgi:hypothetical protein
VPCVALAAILLCLPRTLQVTSSHADGIDISTVGTHAHSDRRATLRGRTHPLHPLDHGGLQDTTLLCPEGSNRGHQALSCPPTTELRNRWGSTVAGQQGQPGFSVHGFVVAQPIDTQYQANLGAPRKRGRGRPFGSKSKRKETIIKRKIWSGWEGQFCALLAFRQHHGHCIVPMSRKEAPNGSGRGKTFDAVGQESLVEGFGSPFSSSTDTTTTVHVGDPQRYDKLARWVAAQRVFCKQHRLDARRIRRLESLGFAWAVIPGRKRRDCGPEELVYYAPHRPVTAGHTTSVTWQKRFSQLVAFRRRHGHCNVPYKSAEAGELGRWVTTQRTFQRFGMLKPERKQQLDQIEFVWDLHTTSWAEYFMLLLHYKLHHGHTNVPYRCMLDTERGARVHTSVTSSPSRACAIAAGAAGSSLLRAHFVDALSVANETLKPELASSSSLESTPSMDSMAARSDLVGSDSGCMQPFSLFHMASQAGGMRGVARATEQAKEGEDGACAMWQTEEGAGGVCVMERERPLCVDGAMFARDARRSDSKSGGLRAGAHEIGGKGLGVAFVNLGAWVNNQRSLHRKGRLTPEREIKYACVCVYV